MNCEDTLGKILICARMHKKYMTVCKHWHDIITKIIRSGYVFNITSARSYNHMPTQMFYNLSVRDKYNLHNHLSRHGSRNPLIVNIKSQYRISWESVWATCIFEIDEWYINRTAESTLEFYFDFAFDAHETFRHHIHTNYVNILRFIPENPSKTTQRKFTDTGIGRIGIAVFSYIKKDRELLDKLLAEYRQLIKLVTGPSHPIR